MGCAYPHDLFVAQSAEGSVSKLKGLACFCRVITRLGTRVQRRSSLQSLALEVDAKGDAILRKEENLPARIGIAAIDGFRNLGRVLRVESCRDGQ